MLKRNSLLIFYLSIAVLLLNSADARSMSTFTRDSKIINGTNAILDDTRHQVSLRIRSKDSASFGSGHTCGGSLISDNVVMTAAHCFLANMGGSFLPDSEFVVVMGNLNRLEANENTLVFDILKTVKHDPTFNTVTLEDDIALIFLKGKVPADHATVSPTVLNDGPVENNVLCQATGWGVTEEGKIPVMLKTVDVPIIGLNECRDKTEYGTAILDGMLCAGYLEGERDSCRSDSGGPLVCHGTQTGIVSWGIGCALPLRPGVYTNVSHYKSWILQQVIEHNGSLPKFASIPDEDFM